MSLTHCVSHCNIIVRITNVYRPALFFNYRVRRGGEESSTHNIHIYNTQRTIRQHNSIIDII